MHHDVRLPAIPRDEDREVRRFTTRNVDVVVIAFDDYFLRMPVVPLVMAVTIGVRFRRWRAAMAPMVFGGFSECLVAVARGRSGRTARVRPMFDLDVLMVPVENYGVVMMVVVPVLVPVSVSVAVDIDVVTVPLHYNVVIVVATDKVHARVYIMAWRAPANQSMECPR